MIDESTKKGLELAIDKIVVRSADRAKPAVEMSFELLLGVLFEVWESADRKGQIFIESEIRRAVLKELTRPK